MTPAIILGDYFIAGNNDTGDKTVVPIINFPTP
jgi:hypothetical protein